MVWDIISALGTVVAKCRRYGRNIPTLDQTPENTETGLQNAVRFGVDSWRHDRNARSGDIAG